MSPKGISTFPRFLFINFYAFLLFIGGIGIGVIPLYQKTLLLIAPQSILVFACIKGSISIFSSWSQKKENITYCTEKTKMIYDQTRFLIICRLHVVDC